MTVKAWKCACSIILHSWEIKVCPNCFAARPKEICLSCYNLQFKCKERMESGEYIDHCKEYENDGGCGVVDHE